MIKSYLATMDLIEVTIEMPDGRVTRGRAKRANFRDESYAVTDAFNEAVARLEHLSGEPCDCHALQRKGFHSTTCAMFKQEES